MPDGVLNVTIGPRQALALHEGATGGGLPNPDPPYYITALVTESVKTSSGEVSTISFW
jgi:hypothetical protein